MKDSDDHLQAFVKACGLRNSQAIGESEKVGDFLQESWYNVGHGSDEREFYAEDGHCGPLATGAGRHSVLCALGTDEWYICYYRLPIPNESPHHRVVCLEAKKLCELIMFEDFSDLIEAVGQARQVGVLTGAGVSTLSGIPDFRGPQGLYKNPDAERIFDIDWFDRDPSVYYHGCRELVYGLDKYEPNAVHRVLARLEERGLVAGIATQNIDMLHQKAGSKNVWEVHGSPLLHHCRRCGAAASFAEVCARVKAGEEVPRCTCGGAFKPDITFFGEMLPEVAFAKSQELAIRSDVFLVLGTSLTVFPAAGLPRLTLQAGGKVFVVNASPTPLDDVATARYADLAAFAAALETLTV